MIRSTAIVGDTVLILDGLLGAVYAFDAPTGRFIDKRVLAKGEGPGEFVRPARMATSGNDSLVFVHDMSLSRITSFDRATWDYVESFSVTQPNGVTLLPAPGSRVFGMFDQPAIGGDPMIHRFDRGGAAEASFGRRHPDYALYRDAGLQLFDITFGYVHDAHLYVSFGLPMEIQVFSLDGEPIRKIRDTPAPIGPYLDRDGFRVPVRWFGPAVPYRSGLLLHFLYDEEEEVTLVRLLDDSGVVHDEVEFRLPNAGWRLYPVPPEARVGDDVFVVSESPFPQLVRVNFTVE